MLALHDVNCIPFDYSPEEQKQEPRVRTGTHRYQVEDFSSEKSRVRIQGAAVTYRFKGEDRHTFWCNDDNNADESNLLSFCGVFDGHGGCTASDYCAKGLLPHILLENVPSGNGDAVPKKRPWTPYRRDPDVSPEIVKATVGLDPLEASYVRAFHRAQEFLAVGEEPPTLLMASSPKLLRKNSRRQRSLRNLLARQNSDEHVVYGGTTACTLSIYSYEDSANSGIYAVVANCGDSRLIFCDQQNAGGFQQVTRDHRPLEPQEWQRLQKSVELGEAYVQPSTARIFPGGLAVSRTIGDVQHSKSVIPTPDVYRWRLDDPTKSLDNQHVYRFVLATDGLWDVLNNEMVAALLGQSHDATPITPRDAASKLIQHCLDLGGYRDDVTILVVDVTITSEEQE